MVKDEIAGYMSGKFGEFLSAVSENLLGYTRISKAMFVAMLLNKHILLEGLPGVGKTSFVKLFSTLTNIDFKRVQCTPDLLPTDVIGSLIYNPDAKKFSIRYGPIFTNLLLVDEINRASPKTQSSLLEAMEEKQVTIEGKSYALDDPFIVLATQNPIEQEGTYALPEAQLDRFLFKLNIAYPSKEDEFNILKLRKKDLGILFTKKEVVDLRAVIGYISVSEGILEYIVAIINELRKSPEVSWGPSPRATLALLEVSKICALLDNRLYVVPGDVMEFAGEILAHRIGLKSEYELEGRNKEAVIKEILGKVDTI